MEGKVSNTTTAVTLKSEQTKESIAGQKQGKKKSNKSWEAFGKSKGCFIVNDPKFFL